MTYFSPAGASRAVALFVFLAALPGAGHALDLSDGTYDVRADGATGTLTIEDGTGSLGIGSTTCSGGMEGPLRQHSDGTMSFRRDYDTGSCTLTLEPTENGLAWISASAGCGYFHGATCGLSGLVVGRAVPVDFGAIDAGFSALDQAGREAVQRVLQDAGHYSGGIDGVTGPGTRVAVRAAGQQAVRDGRTVRLDRREDVHAFLVGLLQAEAPETAGFYGAWTCEGSTYVFGPEGYRTHPDRDPLPYRNIREFTPGNFGVTFVDGYRLGLMDVTDESMIWSSPASGDTFDCTRTANPAPDAGSAEERSAASGAQIAAPVRTRAADPAETPFRGRWTCTSESADTMTFAFAETAATVEEMGRTTSYEAISDLGESGTAFRIDFTDGEVAHLFEVSDASMWLAASGDVFECAAS